MTRSKGWWTGLLLCLAGAAGACDTTASAPAIDRAQVRVWTCKVPGTPLLGFTARTTVTSTLSGLAALLLDTDAAPQWVFRMNRIDLLRQDEQAGTFLLRAESDFWPLRDRDVYLEGQVAQNPETLVVTIDSRSTPAGRHPEHPDFVRMPYMVGHWEFRPLPEGQVEVTMSGRADPGGHIPNLLVNLVIQETPYRTLLGLRRQIGDKRYQQARIPAIREPRR